MQRFFLRFGPAGAETFSSWLNHFGHSLGGLSRGLKEEEETVRRTSTDYVLGVQICFKARLAEEQTFWSRAPAVCCPLDVFVPWEPRTWSHAGTLQRGTSSCCVLFHSASPVCITSVSCQCGCQKIRRYFYFFFSSSRDEALRLKLAGICWPNCRKKQKSKYLIESLKPQ